MDVRFQAGGRRVRGAPGALWLIMICALGLRLGVALTGPDAPASTDEAHWRDMGLAISREGLLAARAHTYRPPLYPMLLAATYAGWSDQRMAVFAWQSLLGAAMCGLVWRIGVRLGGTQVGLLAAAGLAVYPLLVFCARVIMAETLLSFLTLGSILAALRFCERSGWREAVILGLSCGLTALCKPTILAWPPLLLGAWAWRRWRDARDPVAGGAPERRWAEIRHMGSRMAMVVLGMVLILIPGSVRNHALTGHWVPVSTNLGMNLLIGHEPGATGVYRDGVDYLTMFRELVEGEPNAALADRLATRRVLGLMIARPWRTLALAGRKVFYLWSPWITGGGTGAGLIGLVSSAPLLMLGLFGVWYGRSSAMGVTLGTLVVAVTLVHALVFAHTRFRLPLDAALMAPAAWTAQRLWWRWRVGP